jgi:hypothetical protein
MAYIEFENFLINKFELSNSTILDSEKFQVIMDEYIIYKDRMIDVISTYKKLSPLGFTPSIELRDVLS